MNFVHEVGRVTHTHQRAPRVDVILPPIQLLIALQREVYSLVLRLQEQAIRLEVRPFDVRDIGEINLALGLWGSLGWRQMASVMNAETKRTVVVAILTSDLLGTTAR